MSCGFHHTLVVAVPEYSTRVFTTSVLACGWGEHGRLGLGDEDQRMELTMLEFPEVCAFVYVCTCVRVCRQPMELSMLAATTSAVV